MNFGPLWFNGCDGTCLSASMVFEEEIQPLHCDLCFEIAAFRPRRSDEIIGPLRL